MRLGRRMVGVSAVAGVAYWFLRYFKPQHSTLVLNDKVVIVTGATTTTGRALAFSFARRGARVVLVGVDDDRLETVRREIEPYSSDVLIVPADLSGEDGIEAVVTRTLEEFGTIDILVNHTSVLVSGMLVETDPSRLEALIKTNLWIPFRLTQLVVPHMLRNHHGYILNVGSGMGRTPTPLFTAYAATQAGLASFSDGLRRELDGTGIRVTHVMAGWTQSPQLSQEAESILVRYGFEVVHPDEIAEDAVLGLVHGASEVLPGGMLARMGVLAERFAPGLVRLYWRFNLTPEWIAAMRGVGE